MSDFHLLLPNLLSDFTLTTYPGASAGFGVSNILSPLRSKVFRSQYLSLSQIQASSATAISMSGIAIAQTNLTSTATCQLYLYSDSAFTTQIYTSGALSPNTSGNYWQHFFAAQSVKSWIINIIDTANTDGFIQVGKCYTGTDFNPAQSVEMNPAIDSASTSTLAWTASGSPVVESGIDYREISLSFPYLTTTEATTLDDAAYNAVIGGMGWLCLDSTYTGAKQARHSGELVVTEYPKIKPNAAYSTATLSARLI